MDHTTLKTYPKLISFLLCGLSLLFAAYSACLRAEPDLTAALWMQQFHANPADLHLFSLRYQFSLIAAFFLAGLFVDLFGSRTTLCVSVIATAAGSMLFAHANSIQSLEASRILIGWMHPFILVGALKLGAEFLSSRLFAVYVASLFATALLTPEYGAPYLQFFIEKIGLVKAHLPMDILILCLVGVMGMTYHYQPNQTPFVLRKWFASFFEKRLWLLGIVSCAGWMPNAFLQGWGRAILEHNLHFTSAFAKVTEETTLLGFALSAILIALISIKWMRATLFIGLGYLGGLFCLLLILTLPHLPIASIGHLWVLNGICLSVATLCFALAYEQNPSLNHLGTRMAGLALITKAGNTLFTMYLDKNAASILLHPYQFLGWQWVILPLVLALCLGCLCLEINRKRGLAQNQ